MWLCTCFIVKVRGKICKAEQDVSAVVAELWGTCPLGTCAARAVPLCVTFPVPGLRRNQTTLQTFLSRHGLVTTHALQAVASTPE